MTDCVLSSKQAFTLPPSRTSTGKRNGTAMDMIFLANTHSKIIMQSVVHNVLKIVYVWHSLGDEVLMNVT
jgi:hypothetical protein